MRVTYHPDAEAEMLDAAWYYERRVRGLGGRFLHEFDAAIASIRENPERLRIVEDDLRRFVMRRFPYAIYYRTEPDHVRIMVVKHHRRKPGYWRDRLGD